MLRRDAELRQRLERLLDESPDAARQEIRRALEIARKHRQAAAAAKPAAGKPAATTRPAAGVGTKGPGGHRKNAQ
jgi:hypothetical protein